MFHLRIKTKMKWTSPIKSHEYFSHKKTIGIGNPLSKSYFSSAHKKQFGMEIPMKIVFLRIKRKQWEVEISSKSMIFLRIKKIKHNGKWKSPIKSHDL